jgi:hypothetical protein
MRLLEDVNKTLAELHALTPKTALSSHYIFILEDIKQLLEHPTHQPHLNKNSRGEGSYTQLNYHDNWGLMPGYFDLQSFRIEELETLKVFSGFILRYQTDYTQHDAALVTYQAWLKRYHDEILANEINRLNHSIMYQQQCAALQVLTEEYISKLSRLSQNDFSREYLFVLNECLKHLKDPNYQIDYAHLLNTLEGCQSILSSMGVFNACFPSPTDPTDMPDLTRDNFLPLKDSILSSVLLFNQYITSFDASTKVSTLEDGLTNPINQFSSTLIHYQQEVINNHFEGELRKTQGLLSLIQADYYLLPETSPDYQTIQEVTTDLRTCIDDASRHWIENRDIARREKYAEREDETFLLGAFLCLFNPLLGCCLCYCQQLMSDAQLENEKVKDIDYLNNQLQFLTTLENGLHYKTLSYLDISSLKETLPSFQSFTLSLPEIKTIETRFIGLINLLCNALNYLFNAGIESIKTKAIKRNLAFFKEGAPAFNETKGKIDEELVRFKNKVLDKHPEPSAPPYSLLPTPHEKKQPDRASAYGPYFN